MTRTSHKSLLKKSASWVWHRHLAGENAGLKPVPHLFQQTVKSTLSITMRCAWLGCLSACLGCQGLARIMHSAGTDVRQNPESHRVLLAADFGYQTEPQQEAPPRDASSTGTEPSEETGAETTPTDSDDESPILSDRERERAALPKPTYTAPTAEVRQVALAQSRDSTGDEEDSVSFTSGGREAAESMVGATPFVGRPGLSAPQPTIAGVVVSRPGLQEGPAGGLGFASPFNVLTPQSNPVAGRCADLARAGFFGGSRPACETHFRRP